LWLAETSQQPISQTNWLKVTPHCNHCNFFAVFVLTVLALDDEVDVTLEKMLRSLSRCCLGEVNLLVAAGGAAEVPFQ
jgi:hypothetical protein